jgi:two-component system phosphate regulon sensor histidine kinase PhoR
LKYHDDFYQTYRAQVRTKNGSGLTVGFSVSIPWIADSLLPAYERDSSYRKMGALSLLENFQNPEMPASARGVEVPLRTILPFLQLHISQEAIELSEIAFNRELWFLGISVIMFISILALGLYLLIHVSGDIRWFNQRSDFVSGVSHEFKTPLSLIRLYSETLANNDEEFSPEDRKNYIRIIARESERMSRLIDNVLDFSKIEQGIMRHELVEGDLAEVVSQTVADYSEYLEWRGFEVKTSISPYLPPVRFHAEQVSQMILNLLDNARKYSGQSRPIRVNGWAQENEVVIEVQDYGLGIAEEAKEKIFAPFYRISRGSEKGGCGLGLYLVSEVMKEHHGRVEVESEVDKGSRFRLVFPTSKPHPGRFEQSRDQQAVRAHSKEGA